MRYSAVLFDMDGVVIDTHHSVTVFWEALAQQHHVQLTDADFTHHIYGTPATHTLATCFPQLSADERQAVMESLTQYEDQLTYKAVHGVVVFLRALQEAHIPTALVTSADPRKVRNVVDQLGIDGLFSVVVTANDVTKGKPDPQCYMLGAQRLQYTPDQCIVFEDALSGVKAAVAAGTTCVGIQQTAQAAALEAVGARYVVPDFTAVRLDESGSEDGTLTLRLSTSASLTLIRG